MRVLPFFACAVGFTALSASCSSSQSDLFGPIPTAGTGGTSTSGSDSNSQSAKDAGPGSGQSGRGGTESSSGAGVSAGGANGIGDGGAGGMGPMGSSGSTNMGAGGSDDDAGPGAPGGSGQMAGGAGGVGGASGESNGMAGKAGGGSGGIAGRTIDGGAADAGKEHPIQCGSTTCFAPQEFCCIPNGGNARCAATIGGTCAAGADKVFCDDRTDCADVTRICCAADAANGSSVADCRLPSACVGPKAQVLCDAQEATSCVGSGRTGRCATNGQPTIDGYAYCH